MSVGQDRSGGGKEGTNEKDALHVVLSEEKGGKCK